MTPAEAAILLQAMGFGRSTVVYVATYEGGLYGGNQSLDSLRSYFPNAITKADLSSEVSMSKVQFVECVLAHGLAFLADWIFFCEG